jgi:secreted trypsin-like serine protease
MSVKILNSNDARGALDAATSRLDSVPIGADTPAPDNPDLLVVAIRYLKNGAPDLCTGTLIDSKHVLTAGHCACGSNYEIILDDRADNAQVRPITGGPQLFGKDLCRDFRPVGDDLALLTLADPVRCPAVIDARGALSADCRTDAAHAKANAPYRTFGYPQELFYDILPRLERVGRLRAFGYGFTEKGTLGVRMYADIPIESTTCTERGYASECAPYSEIVLGERSGRTARKDTCRGDSGGPVFLMESGRYTLVAVTSRASSARPDDPRLNCGGGGIYTVVSRESVRRWLKANGVDEIQTLTSRAAAGAAASRPR